MRYPTIVRLLFLLLTTLSLSVLAAPAQDTGVTRSPLLAIPAKAVLDTVVGWPDAGNLDALRRGWRKINLLR